MSKTLLIVESNNNFRLADDCIYDNNKIFEEHNLIYKHCHMGNLIDMDNANWSKCKTLLKMHGFDYVLIDAGIEIDGLVLILEEFE